MNARRTSRLTRALFVATTVVATGGAVSACAASAGDLAKAACRHVNSSLSLLAQSDRTTDPTAASTLSQRAYLALLPAIPIAAQAAYHDISWESLSTTLSEANRVPESELAPALRAQCQTADSSVFNQPPPPANPAGG